MLVSDTTKIKWHNRTKSHFVSFGYKFTKFGEGFEVKITDLPKGSNAKVEVLCDYCLEDGIETIISTDYYKYLKRREIVETDCCKKCSYKKSKEVNLKLYGVENAFQLKYIQEKAKQTQIDKYGTLYSKTDERKEKIRNTNLNRYGVVAPLQNESIKEKVRQTNIIKYGVENVFQLEEIQEKLRNTLLERYGVEYISQTDLFKESFKKTSLEKFGVEHPFQNEEVKEKIKETNLERYGFACALQNPEIKKKQMDSFFKNGTTPTSSQQLFIYEILKEKGYNVELNYPLGNVFLDVALFIGEIKIDVEYDGWYWHKGREIEDRRRDEFLKSQGWKILRIKSRRALPTHDEILQCINKLTNTDRKFSILTLSDWNEKEED